MPAALPGRCCHPHPKCFSRVLLNAAPPSPLYSRSGPAAAILVLVIVAAYISSFGGALVFDDIPGILNNPTIRDPSQLMVAIGPQGGTLSGRPLPNLTLALNYAISGERLWSYHAFNLAIHALAGLALFGLVHRTLLRAAWTPPLAPDAALTVAWASAALWALHPLQTESVTYLVQRVESLCGLFYLLTLYCFARAVDSPRPRAWQVATVLACLGGMASKEVMVSAPLLVLLYDRAFVTGSWRESWRLRWRLHLALMSTWLLLAALIAATENRAGTAGLGTAVHWWEYALKQCEAIVHYLRLAVWPRPLVFDYGTAVVRDWREVAPEAGLLIALALATGWAVVRRPAAGFFGAWFFLILAPSSSIVPVATQTMTEHRMYLPLAAVVVPVALLLHRGLGRRAMPVFLLLAVALGATTARRNLDYHSPLDLWADSARKLPANGRAHNNAGALLLEAGRIDEARARFDTALELDPTHASAHYNLGNLFARTGRPDEAIAAYETALRHDPTLADAHVNLGDVLRQRGRAAEAIPHYEEAVRLEPWMPDARSSLAQAHFELGNRLAGGGNFDAAVNHYRRTLELDAGNVRARTNLANALLMAGKIDDAIGLYRLILDQRPDDAAVRENLARALELRR